MKVPVKAELPAPNVTLGLKKAAITGSLPILAKFERASGVVCALGEFHEDEVKAALKQITDNGIGFFRAIQKLAEDRSPGNLKKINSQVTRHVLGALRALDTLESLRARNEA